MRNSTVKIITRKYCTTKMYTLLMESESFKYLGVVIDQHLSFNDHICTHPGLNRSGTARLFVTVVLPLGSFSTIISLR